MPFTGGEGGPITLPKAIEMTTAYRNSNPDPNKILSVFLGTNILRTLLEQPESKGIRFYYGLDGEKPQLVAVSADRDENDLFNDGYIIADEGMQGPPNSGLPNVLNS